MTREPSEIERRLPSVLLCESSRKWATWWRSGCAGRDSSLPWRLIELRSVSELRREVLTHPAAFVVLELTPTNLATVLEWLDELPQRGPQVLTTVVASRELSGWEMIVRQAGAVGWATSPPAFWRLIAMAARFAEQHSPPKSDITERVWAKLPWRAVEPLPSQPQDWIEPINFIEEV